MNDVATVPAHIPQDRVFDFDIYADPRIDADVQGSLQRVLKDAPDIFWTPRHGGAWILCKPDYMMEAVKDADHFSSRCARIPFTEAQSFLRPINQDPPHNAPFRRMLNPTFSPRAVRDMESKLRQRAIEVIDQVVDKGSCDFAYEVAAQYPVSVFMDLMGLPIEELRSFRELAEAYFKASNDEEFLTVDRQIGQVMLDLIKHKRQFPADDLASRLVGSTVLDRAVTDEELLSMFVLLFLGGMDTVTNMTGFTFQHLARQPDLQDTVASNPALMPDFVEEAVRLFGVVSLARYVAKDCNRFGVEMRSGEMIACIQPLVGRDANLNPDPQTFDIERKNRQHLTFGGGAHLCVGHLLARAELRILTEEWLRRIPRFELVPGAQVDFRLGQVVAMLSLPIQWSLEDVRPR